MSEHTARQTTGGAEASAPPAAPRRLRLRNMRIRTKLALILIAPLLAISALAGVRLLDSAEQARQAQTLRSLVEVSAASAALVHELHAERIAAAGLLDDPDNGQGAFSLAASRVDTAATSYQRARANVTSQPDQLTVQLATIEDHLTELEAIRAPVIGQDDTPVSATSVVLRYGTITTALQGFTEALIEAVDDPDLAAQIRAVAALSAAKQHAADAQATAILPGPDGSGAALAALAGQAEAFAAFERAANGPQRAAADIITSTVSQPAMKLAEDQLLDQLLSAVTQRRDQVYQQVLIETVAVGLALGITIATALLLASALARSLRRLRQHALHVADRELPDTVARLADPNTLGENTPAQLAAQVREPARLRSRDEIGQVAQSFAVVHRTTVRIAAEQAALRTSVSAMFLNLARRSQNLVDRVISQLDKIERNEEDPKRLAELFVLDHLATRMRRNDENLLVLAGADSSPPRTDDALVADVLRAAQSEVEHYARIEFGTIDPDVSVAATAVNDVVRLAAELFDNATRFSSPNSLVVCEARRVHDQVIVHIEDQGVGMSPEQVQRVNAWLAAPPAVEVTTFRKMGLAVVSRLAARYGIAVQLRCDPNQGTIAYVYLPPGILVLPPSRHARIAPPPPQPDSPPLSAGHLGQLPRSAAVVRHAANRREATYTQPAQPYREAQHAPVTGRPLPEQLTTHPALQAPPVPEGTTTVELPIFKEIEAAWFRNHRTLADVPTQPGPRAGSYPTAAATDDATPARPAASSRPAAAAPSAPEPVLTTRPDPAPHPNSDQWHTAADHGWVAAAAAAEPSAGGSTSSGLPKRVPQAQLVPGSVTTTTETPAQRRSPEQVRGLLSAYTRGVQRGRAQGGS